MSVEIPRCSAFNGVVLPNLPDYDATAYPNTLIRKDGDLYILIACSQQFVAVHDATCSTKGAEFIGFCADVNTCSWTALELTLDEIDANATYITICNEPVWSFLPIYSNTDSTMVVYEAGTLEEWDAEQPTITSLTGAEIANDEGTATGYWQGDTATPLVCTAEVSDGGILSYKWYKNGEYVASGNSFTPSTNEVGQFAYYCVVTNTLRGASGFSDVDTAKSESMVIVVTAKEEDGGDTGDGGDTATKRLNSHIIGYVLRKCGVPMAELIAEMICNAKKVIGYSYNGTVLPKLPEWDEKTYPYAVMAIQEITDTLYVANLFLCAECPTCGYWYANAISKGDDLKVSGDVVKYVLYSDIAINDTMAFDVPTANAWVFVETKTYSSDTKKLWDEREAIWTNADVLYSGHRTEADGGVFLAASDPIPVYE